ncbi:MAG: hypothetical protein N3A72_02215 [bacterium]|nr:hypothetical protein [bacterium]
MITNFPLDNSKWFYDNTGYYSYLLFRDITENEYKDIEQIIKKNGLKVLHAGFSYRPASNGILYKWFYRISDEKGEHPSQEKIDNIFSTSKITKETKTQGKFKTNIKPNIPIIKQKEDLLEEKLSSIEIELQKITVALDENKRLNERLEHSRKQYDELYKIYEKVQLDLKIKRKKIRKLEEQLLEIQKAVPGTERSSEIIEKLRVENSRLNQEYENKSDELNKYIKTFDSELKDKQKEIDNLLMENTKLQTQLNSLNLKIEQLVKQYSEAHITPEKNVRGKNPNDLFRDMLRVFLPQIDFMPGTIDTLWSEIKDPIEVLQDIRALSTGNIKGKRVEGTHKWFERKDIDYDYRFYYRQCKDGMWKVFIGQKKTQKLDVERLKQEEKIEN